MSVNRTLKIYLQELIFELNNLKTILEFENQEIKKEVNILNITNPRKDLIINSINNYYITINSWLKKNYQKQEEIEKLIAETNLLKEIICIQYQNICKTLQNLFDQKTTIPKIQFPQNLFSYTRTIAVDVKI
ncbi:hypothetical protein [Borrelia sp. HM]|uniref:hypothetical protein n=1 Tax=Borrelia sp. HM TaxID=1882662 RepID=UPI001C77B7AD|nr:hypothetical protein [Borrelia sp. HM]BCR21969.1 hypothetical protein BKFM_00549 [Borrelia sp. HM]